MLIKKIFPGEYEATLINSEKHIILKVPRERPQQDYWIHYESDREGSIHDATDMFKTKTSVVEILKKHELY